MTKTVKMCDLASNIAIEVFRLLNPGKIQIVQTEYWYGPVIVTDVEPKNLIYPEGWYYAKGTFRNKHNSTTGMYSEIFMKKSNGIMWEHIATYSTR